MTLSVSNNFLSELGTYSLQGSTLKPQPNSLVQSSTDQVDLISSPTILFSENTKQTNVLYQSLVNDLSARAMAAVGLKANDIAGKQSQFIDYSLTLVTRDVYRQRSLGIGDYVRLSNDDLSKAGIDPNTLNDSSTGFQAGVYKNNGLYIVSFTGSNELKDFMVSIRQGLGYSEKQYDQAIELANKALKIFGENVIFTGHSLGGGLASVAALTTGKPAVIYNSSGVSDSTLKRMGISPEAGRELASSGLIRHYVVQHDWLDNLQKILPVPQPMGNKIELEYELKSTWDALPHRYGLHSFKAHFLEAVLELMTDQKPWLNNRDVMLASADSTDEDMVSLQVQSLQAQSSQSQSLQTPSLQALAQTMDDPAITELFEDAYRQIASLRV
ncbi:phospholipase [Xenorhabdus hominickii]|uniref:Phospholipase n=1 Tax=Xenorhabdus hominickii TaxID=351679 RepID=A0A2G0Q746_XENHO|nr:phospholipase [Xenorhabdus hominickii]AOM39236.1 phospholipase [Xenorhabdus hominickii]PHM55023.1 phospholipase A [Xenorhabdus hominickii]